MLLFETLLKQGKQIASSGKASSITRKKRIALESSINETLVKVYDLQEEQKAMLCDPEKFDHIVFAKKENEIIDHMRNLEVLSKIANKLFDIDPSSFEMPDELWGNIIEETKNAKQGNNNQAPKKEEDA